MKNHINQGYAIKKQKFRLKLKIILNLDILFEFAEEKINFNYSPGQVSQTI